MTSLIIAEVGVNHNGSIENAKQLIDVAKKAGADIVKFQTFKTEHLVTADAKKAQYQKANMNGDDSQYQMLKALELNAAQFIELKRYCDEIGIEFLSTAFDSDSLDFLIRDVGLNRLKIPSGELTNTPFVMQHARTNLPLIISTGMSDLEDVNRALLGVSLASNTELSEKDVFRMLVENRITSYPSLSSQVTLLHCTTEYPAPVDTINLKAMNTLANTFQLPIGYSDHSCGFLAAAGAIALGAKVIEKHITLSKTLPGPDHRASMEPAEFTQFVQEIRKMEILLGNGDKKPVRVESENKLAARKSVVAAKPIKKGDVFTFKNLTAKRPGNGLPPFELFRLIDQLADQEYNTDEPIRE